MVQSAMYGLSHGPRRAGSGRRAAGWGDAGLWVCGILSRWSSAIARRVGGDGWTPETPPDRDRVDLLVERGIGEEMRGVGGDEGRESDSPVDEGATRTGTLFLVACVRVPCARLPELTNEKKLETGAGQETGAERARAKFNLRNARRGPILPPSQHGG